MKNDLSIDARLSASRSAVTGNGSWLWLISSLLCGFVLSGPLGFFLFKNKLPQLLNACKYQLGGALGLADNSLLQKLNLGPTPLELRYGKIFFSEYQISIWSVVIAQVAGMVVYLLFFSQKKTQQNLYQKLRSGERDAVSVHELASEIAKAVKTMGPDFKSHPHDFLFSGLKGLRIPERSLASMLGIVGGAGQGKTNVLRQFVASRREIGGKCFIVDVNGEYASIFSRPGDIVLSLHDTRAAKWDLWNEDIPKEDLAESILEIGESSHSTSAGEFFSTASYTVLVALLKGVKNEAELWQILNLPRDKLADKIRSEPGLAKHMLGATNDGQTAGVLATALRKLPFFEHLNQFSKERELKNGSTEEAFSVSHWVKDNTDKRWVFLIATDATLNQTKTLFRIWISTLTKSLMARCESEENERIYLVCDELGSVGKIPRLSDFLTAVRRKNGRAVLGFQSMSQLESIFGKTDSSTILQGLQNLIVFRCADPTMAKLMSERIGKIEIVEHAFSQNRDQKTKQYVPQVSERVREKWVFSPNTIANLSIGEGILCMAQFSACLVKFKKVDFPIVLPTAESFERIPLNVGEENSTESDQSDSVVAETKALSIQQASGETSADLSCGI